MERMNNKSKIQNPKFKTYPKSKFPKNKTREVWGLEFGKLGFVLNFEFGILDFAKRIRQTFELIKFSHSLFALPFALASMVVAAHGWPAPRAFLLIVAAMIAARSAAVAFNRLVDAEIDAENPRTQNRHIPQGLVSKKFVFAFTFSAVLLFLTTAHFLNPLAFLLSPLVMIFLLGYSFTKRFTWLSHLWLGISLGLAPLAAWVAVKGEWPWPVLWLGTAVTFWVAGFDIIYATQDFEFDRTRGLHSLVARFGIGKALWVSRLLHLLCMGLFILFGLENRFGIPYFTALGLIAVGLIREQGLIRPGDLSKVNAAFFNVNGIIGILFFIGVLLEMGAH